MSKIVKLGEGISVGVWFLGGFKNFYKSKKIVKISELGEGLEDFGGGTCKI